MEKEQREIQSFARRLRPSVRYFYRAAFAITADRQMSELVLGRAFVTAYMKGLAPAGVMGFRDSVLTVIRECALDQLEVESSENDWDGFSADPARDDRLADLIARETPEVQRMCVLRYGCAATVREIAQLLGVDTRRVQEELSRSRMAIESTLAREKRPARPFDRLAMRAVRQAMNQESENQIDVDYILHAFETELAGRKRPQRIFLRVSKAVLFTVVGVVAAGVMWLLAVLLEM